MLKILLRYSPVQITSALSIFVLIALQTRYLGAEEYGELSVYLVLVEMTRAVYSQWLNTGLIRYYPSADETEKNLYSNVVFSGVIGLFFPISIILTVILFTFFEDANWLSLTTILGLLIIKSLFIFFQEIARLNERADQYRKATTLQAVMSILVTWLLLEWYPSVTVTIFGLTLSYLVSLPLIWFLPSKFKIYQAKSSIATLVKYGLPLMISGLIGIAGSRIDRFFIADQLGYIDTGIYSALSNMLLGLMSLIFMAVALPLYPILARNADDKEQLYCSHQRYQIIVLTISLPSLIGLCFIGEPLVRLFLGEAYLTAGIDIFFILAISAFIFNFRMHYIDHGLQFSSKTNIMPIILATSLLTNIVMLLFLLPIFGLYGAAYASLVCNLVSLMMSLFFANKAGHEYRVNIEILKVGTSSLCMICTLYLFKVSNLWPKSDLIEIFLSIVIGVSSFTFTAISMNIMNSRKMLINRWIKNHA